MEAVQKNIGAQECHPLALQADRLLSDLVRRGDHLRVGLVPTLENDEIGEFMGNVRDRALDRAAHDAPAATTAGESDGG